MPSVAGIHVENYHIGEGAAERNAIIGRDGAATLLHLQAAQVYPEIRRDLGPDVLIHVRMYQPNWYVLDPRKWARDCFDILIGIPGLLDDPRVLITGANEPDLATEGHPGAATVDRPHPTLDTWREIWSWSLAFSSEWRASVRGARAKLGTTPLAGGHEPKGFPPDYEYQMLEFRQHARDCDAVVVHGYCNRDWSGHSPETAGYWAALRAIRPAGYRERDGAQPIGGIPDPGGVAMQLSEKPFFVAEMGNWHHHDAGGTEVESTLGQFRSVYRTLSDTRRCLGATLFIFNSGAEHRENRFFGNAALIQGLVAMERFEAAEFGAAAPPSQTKPWSEQYPREFAEWVAAGGVDSNFGRHIKAIRQDIPITGADVLDAIGGAKAAADQAALISARYKFTK